MASLILLIIVVKPTQSIDIINQIIEIKKLSSRSTIETVDTAQHICEEEGLFSCKDRWNTCIDLNKMCDGEIDCYNGYDEDNCASLDEVPTNSSCTNDEFVCIGANRTCQSKSSICDGIVDCPNGEDEEKCEKQKDEVSDLNEKRSETKTTETVENDYNYEYNSSEPGSGDYYGGLS